MNIEEIQSRLREAKVSGWLLYDFRGNNPLAREVLEVPLPVHATRRFLYWIPAEGEPIKIVHAIESGMLDHLPGKKTIYLQWQTFERLIAQALCEAKAVAMEYSLRIPYVSRVDAGMIDFIRQCGVEIVSSAPFLQTFTAVLDAEQLDSHLKATAVLDQTANKTWDWLRENLSHKKMITEYDIQQFIMKEIAAAGCLLDGKVICGVGLHSADPHYTPTPKTALTVHRGDWILIDLWCKTQHPRAVYGDITRVAVADTQPSPRQEEIFQLVRKAQTEAITFVAARFAQKKSVYGYEVDSVARKVIADAGYGPQFGHRLGHSIYTDAHGPGANLDSLETCDDRPLISKTCFSVEPGIYLPGEFGVRLEVDVYIEEKGELRVSPQVQEKVVLLY